MRSFSTYIKTITKSVGGPNVRISAQALSEADAIVVRTLEAVSLGVRRLLISDGKTTTISNEKVLAAYQLLAPTNTFAIGRAAATQALKNYEASTDERSRLEAKAGLTLSVSLCRKYLLSFTPKDSRISRTAPIVLAALAEKVISEILELSSNSARDKQHVTIQPRDIMFAIYNDLELTVLMRSIGYQQRSGGVVPNINKGLIATDKKYKKSTRDREPGVLYAHRFRPGTVSLRMIRRYQKSDANVVSLTTSRRIIKAALASSETKFRISKQAHELLHELLESEAASVLTDAVRLTVHAGRMQTTGADVKLAVALRWPADLVQLLPSSEEELKKPELTRLSYRAGVKTRTENFFKSTNDYITGFLTWIVSKAALATEAAGRKTLLPADVGLALDALSIGHGGL